jgi:hypothetical protein
MKSSQTAPDSQRDVGADIIRPLKFQYQYRIYGNAPAAGNNDISQPDENGRIISAPTM